MASCSMIVINKATVLDDCKLKQINSVFNLTIKCDESNAQQKFLGTLPLMSALHQEAHAHRICRQCEIGAEVV